MSDERPPEPGMGARVGEAVAIAALSALMGGLVDWGLDVLKKRRRKRKARKVPRGTGVGNPESDVGET